MTTRLYYTEPARTSFDATVLACDTRDGKVEVVLDQTAFYPTSGGQPFDTGAIAGARVLDVQDRDDGTIVHVVDRTLSAGTAVSASIDWPRRFDHMQQHTGQHVLSAAFDRLFDVRTESFHLGTSAATIDLARPVSTAEITAAEDEANRIVWEDRPVTVSFASAEEAATLPLRKEPVRSGPLRLVAIDAFDLSACGGTHVARTGAIGVIATSGWEKLRGGTRIEFLCGGRALSRFRAWREALAAVTRTLSVTPGELQAGIERLQADAKAMQRSQRALQEQLAAHEAGALLSRTETVAGRVIVAEALDGWDAAGLKALATATAAAEPTAAIALFTRTSPALVVVARGSTAAIDASAVLKALFSRFGGKGGGRPELAQGGGLAADAADLVAAARELLAS